LVNDEGMRSFPYGKGKHVKPKSHVITGTSHVKTLDSHVNTSENNLTY